MVKFQLGFKFPVIAMSPLDSFDGNWFVLKSAAVNGGNASAEDIFLVVLDFARVVA